MTAADIDALVREAEEHNSRTVEWEVMVRYDAAGFKAWVYAARTGWPACARAVKELRAEVEKLRGDLEAAEAIAEDDEVATIEAMNEREHLRSENERLTRERDEALTRCQHLNTVEARIEDLFECRDCEHAEVDECVRAELLRIRRDMQKWIDYRIDPDRLLSDAAVEAARNAWARGVGSDFRAAIAAAIEEAKRTP